MQISRTTLSPTQVKLKITANQQELESIKQHVLGHFARSVKVPGFRAGRTPARIIEKQVDQKALADEFLDHAMNGLYRKALETEDLRPVAAPDVKLKKFVPYSQLEFEVEAEVVGKVSLPDYKKIKLPKPKVTVTAQDVKEVLTSLQTRLAQRSETDRPAKLGDEVVIDFSGFDHKNQPVSGAKGKDYPLILGSSQFIPGFEENLIGVKSGQSAEFTLTFPKNYGVSALRGKKVTFKTDVKKVSEMKLPKLDDELAQKAGPFKTLAELKADVKKQLRSERELNAQRNLENELISRIAGGSSVDIPKSMVDEQIVAMEEEEKRNLTYRGQTWQEHLTEEGITEEQHRERQRPQAEARVKAGLVLSEIAERESLKVTPEELEVRLRMLKEQYQDPAMQAELDKPEARSDITARLLTEKTISKIVQYASK
ncbi:trigger factor [Candidatus Saccharibacteria bacterium RIFCSPHIGHO2_12_FULL_49_19]|nr:MAG: trigger factor [Candidatus Saccharibacteria bacterium RIFCSPHIGHO2_01_FULL_49_21]OGL37810.1 MAG: trigger factor [Candidatus Saccharibacteria bacterium RIFCSPHIGHO2_12_FULL_49_19]OGL38601.1 MAG: trigger factor [Candidatus Saccharibacteria bacterium RIFCSPLOWO2_01_FULL_49_22]